MHNVNAPDPFALLNVLDELTTVLRINPYQTPISGLELSTTVRADNAWRLCENMLSYLNRRPNMKAITRDGYNLPYVDVECGQHTFKLYAPTHGALRVELKANKMQFLGPSAPAYMADLVDPDCVAHAGQKLIDAIDKTIWHYPVADLSDLTPQDAEFYLRGQVYGYWQVRRRDYATRTEFSREEKRRQREKVLFNQLVSHYWKKEPPAIIRQRIAEQTARYLDTLHSGLYQTMLAIYHERWQQAIQLANRCNNAVDTLPLPKRLKLPPLSETYPLYFGRFQTFVPKQPEPARSSISKRWLSANDLQHRPDVIAELLAGLKPRRRTSKRPEQTDAERAWKRQRNRASNGPNNALRQLRKTLNVPGGLLVSDSELTVLLSASARVALAYTSQTLADLRQSSTEVLVALPLFA